MNRISSKQWKIPPYKIGIRISRRLGMWSPPTMAPDPMRGAEAGRSAARMRWPIILGLGYFGFVVTLAVGLLTEEIVAYGVFSGVGLLAIYLAFPQDWRRKNFSSQLRFERVSLDTALFSLSQIAESRDRELAGHSERVAKNAVEIGKEMGLHQEDLEKLWWAGLLHDVGKIGLAESILQKPGTLTEAERQEVRKHPEYGAQIVAPFCRGLPEIPDAIRFHHERWDGLGYPDGLVSTDIPLFARVLAVADVFEALTSHRSYRDALTAEQASIYILNQSGTHFDPAVVRAFDTSFRLDSLLVAVPEPMSTNPRLSPNAPPIVSRTG